MLHDPACPRKILVVEDDDDIRGVLVEMLEMEGYEVLTAEHGARACELLAKDCGNPCLILLDLMMPVMNGWELLEHLKSHPEMGNPPVLVLTAGRTDSVESNQVVGVLTKPVPIGNLLTQIEHYC